MSDKSAEGRRDPAVLRALLDRVRAAEGPDREIDADLCIAFQVIGMPPIAGDNVRRPDGGGPWSSDDLFHEPCGCDAASSISASIDAVAALLKHAMPQSFWSVCDMENGPAAVIIRPMPDGGYIGGGMYAEAATPPLAFLAALLRSLIANAEEGR